MATHVYQRLCFALLGLLSIVSLGCKAENKFVEPPPPKVMVAQPVEQDVVNSIEFTGTTRAVKSVEIRARVNGYLEKVAFRDGADVQEGDLLFVIDQEPFQAEVDISNANLQRSEAALDLAKANLVRTTQLAGQNASSAQQVDISKAEKSTAEANVKAAEAQLKQAKLNLSYTEIRSPINGRIGSHLIDEGNLVRSAESILAIIESIDPIHAYFYVGERDLLWFMQMLREHKLPDPAKTPPVLQMRLENETEYQHSGHLDYRALGVDPQTGTVLRRGLFSNTDGFLIPGLFVHIRAPIGTGVSRLLIEERAIGTDQRGDYILVVNQENVVEYRPIKTGIAVGNLRVIEEGIAKDEWLVVNGLQRARPGAPVTPEKTVTETNTVKLATPPTETAKTEQAKTEALTTSNEQAEKAKPETATPATAQQPEPPPAEPPIKSRAPEPETPSTSVKQVPASESPLPVQNSEGDQPNSPPAPAPAAKE